MTSTTHTGAIDAGAVEKAARAIGDAWDCPEEDDDRLRVYAQAAVRAYLAALATPSPTAASETSDLAEIERLDRAASKGSESHG